MALQTPAVSLVSVAEPQAGLYSFSLRLVVADDEGGWDGIDQSFSDSFPVGGSPAAKVVGITKDMQEVIDRYERVKIIAKHQALDDAITSIQSGLVV